MRESDYPQAKDSAQQLAWSRLLSSFFSPRYVGLDNAERLCASSPARPGPCAPTLFSPSHHLDTMTPQHLLLPLLTTLALAVAGCSKSSEPAAPAATTAPAAATATPVAMTGSAYDTAANTGKGFTVGAMMSAQPVYVLFEPQCPHCGHLWEASKELQGKVKFVWIPVAFNQGKSLAQAATLLSASNPLETMTEHEKSVLAGTGGISASSSVSPELEQAIKANTQLLTTLGQDSVPFVVAKNRQTGEVITHTGAMDSAGLAKFLGVD